MTIRIERNDEGISWEQVANLFQAVGWGKRDPQDVRAAFARSTFKAYAFDRDELIASGGPLMTAGTMQQWSTSSFLPLINAKAQGVPLLKTFRAS